MLPYLPEIKKSMLKNILKGELWRFNFERIRSVNYVAKLRVWRPAAVGSIKARKLFTM